MSLKSSKKGEHNQVTLEIRVENPDFKTAIDQAYKKNVKRIQLPGFRKGHAPRKIIEGMYGKDFFWEDAINDLLPVEYEKAVEESGIVPVAQAKIEVEDLDENGFTVIAHVVVRPEIAIGKYKGLTGERVKVSVDEAAVENELKRIQERGARLVPVEERPLEQGDTANIDFEGFKDGVPFDGGKGDDFDLTLGSGQFIPGFEEAVEGHKVGEHFEIALHFPEDYHVEELKGQPVIFKVTINSATHKELPALDDELAKDVSEFDTLEELKADIRSQIEKSLNEAADSGLEENLLEQITETIEGEIPDEMVDERIDQLMNDFKHQISQQGLDMDLYYQYTGADEKTVREGYRSQADRQVKTRLVLEKVADLEGIVHSDEEVETDTNEMAEKYGIPIGVLRQMVKEADIREDGRVKKALAIIKDSAKIKEVEPEKKKGDTKEKTETKESKPRKPRKPKAEAGESPVNEEKES